MNRLINCLVKTHTHERFDSYWNLPQEIEEEEKSLVSFLVGPSVVQLERKHMHSNTIKKCNVGL